MLATPKITEWLRTCPSSSKTQKQIPSDSPKSQNKKNKRGRRRAVKKKKDEAARQLLLDPIPKSTDGVVATPEDPKADSPSTMSPELRERHSTWNHASSVRQRAAVQDEQDVTGEKCGLTAVI